MNDVETAAVGAFRYVPTAEVRESPMNPRKYFNPERLADLVQSVREKGVLTPLLVRPQGDGYEIAAGHRRCRAAIEAGVEQLPVLVREMDDASFLEVLVIENDQRDDVHPLEEAAGYKALMLTAHFTVERLAERVGRSTKYIYDRIKLLELSEPAQKLFMDGLITAGHAILLARLSAEDQERAIGTPDDYSGYGQPEGGLFVEEKTLFDNLADGEDYDAPKPGKGLKTVSVREFEQWIDKNVRFHAVAPDPMLFPEAAAAITNAQEEAEKVVHITFERDIANAAKADGQRTYTRDAWKRADEEGLSCEHAVTGVIVVGTGRGRAFKVCVAKKKCSIHWADEQKLAAQYSAGSSKAAGDSQRDTYGDQQRKWKEQQARREAEGKRWEKASPRILEALAARLKTLPASTESALGKFLLTVAGETRAAAKYLQPGRTAEDLVRFLVFKDLEQELRWGNAPDQFQKTVAAFGLDAEAIVDGAKAAPPKKAAAKAKPTKASKAKPAKRSKAKK